MRVRTRHASFLKHLTGPDDLGLRRNFREVAAKGRAWESMDVGNDKEVSGGPRADAGQPDTVEIGDKSVASLTNH